MCDESWGVIDLSKASIGLDFEFGKYGAVVLNGDSPECGQRVIIAHLPKGARYGWDDVQLIKAEWQKRAHRALEPLSVLDVAAILQKSRPGQGCYASDPTP